MDGTGRESHGDGTSPTLTLTPRGGDEGWSRKDGDGQRQGVVEGRPGPSSREGTGREDLEWKEVVRGRDVGGGDATGKRESWKRRGWDEGTRERIPGGGGTREVGRSRVEGVQSLRTGDSETGGHRRGRRRRTRGVP